MFVEEGTVSADKGYVCTSDGGSDVVGTNNLVFALFTYGGAVSGSAGDLQYNDGSGGLFSKPTLNFDGSELLVECAIRRKVEIHNVSALPFTVGAGDYSVMCGTTTAGGALTVELPTTTAADIGRELEIADYEGNASTNNITILAATSPSQEKINGANGITVQVDYTSLVLRHTGIVGNEWVIVARYVP
jgi:hypothetical protein